MLLSRCGEFAYRELALARTQPAPGASFYRLTIGSLHSRDRFESDLLLLSLAAQFQAELVLHRHRPPGRRRSGRVRAGHDYFPIHARLTAPADLRRPPVGPSSRSHRSI